MSIFKRTPDLTATIPDGIWATLDDYEQGVVMAIDDAWHERYPTSELRRRLDRLRVIRDYVDPAKPTEPTQEETRACG